MTKALQLGDTVKLSVNKYDPTRDSAPHYETYEVPYTREIRVLEALDYIVEELGESLAYQWYCGVKKCGLCGVRVNGKPVLACWEKVEPEMVIEPLANFPVLHDLVVDRGRFDADVQRVEPWIQRNAAYTGFPEPLTPDMMGYAIEMIHCIECLACNSACPSYGPSSKFVGPAPLVRLGRFQQDPRDRGPRARLAEEQGSVVDCVNCYQCVEVCPNKIDILEHAIDPLRMEIVKAGLGDVARHNTVYRQLFMEQGVVNPSTLLLRMMGWRIISEIPFAFKLSLRGRVSPRKVLRGLLKMDAMATQGDLVKLAKAVSRDEEERRTL